MYCHLNVKTGTRADGQSAVAKYAYISRTGKYAWGFHDDVVHVESGNMPAFAASDPRLYWVAADEYERSNGRLFRSLTAALPNALDFGAQLALARSFAVYVTGGEFPYTLALHAGDVNRGGIPDNPHFHLVFSERVNDGVLRAAEDWFRRAAAKGRDPASGGARKSTRTKPREWLIETRQAWAAHMNRAFERAGVADRATADSHWTQMTRAAVAGDVMEMERLLLNPPAPHIGPAAKRRWDDRDLEEKPDRYAQHEEAVAAAWEIWWAHTKDVAESEMGWTQVAELNARIETLEVEQRAEDAAAERERERLEAERREAEQRRIVSAARSALLTDAAIEDIRVAAEEEQKGTGWAALEAATVARLERKEAAESAAEEIGLTARVVYTRAQEENADAVAMLEKTTEIFTRARDTGFGVGETDAICREAKQRQGAGWLAAVEAAVDVCIERKVAVESAAQDAGVDVGAARETAEFLGEDPVAFLEGATEIAVEARGALLSDDAVRDIHDAAESEARGSGWRTVKAATAVRLERKQVAETRAHEAGITDFAAVYAAAQSRNVDPVAALEEETTSALQAAEERERQLEAGLVALRERRCEGVSVGGEWFYTRKLAELERGQRQSSPEHREQALAWAGRQMDHLDFLREENALDLFFRKLDELGTAQRSGDIEKALDHAEEQLRQAAERRQNRIDALSDDERNFFEEKLEALEPSWRETETAQPAHIDEALDYARTQLDALDRDIERRRVDIQETRGDLLQADFESESRQRKIRALTTVETYLHGEFDRQEKKIRTHAAGEDFLRRSRVEVLGADRQPATLVERSAVIVAAAAHLWQAEAERREARHQMVSGMSGGAERLRAAGWEEARSDDEKDQVLATVERDFEADFDHRERQLRTDDEAEDFLRRGRVEVLEADREPETLAERGTVIHRAEALRQAAVVDRKRQAADRRVARLKRLFALLGGDEAFFAALDAHKATWRETGTRPADIDFALDLAEQRVDRTKATTAEHKVIVDAEQKFREASSAAWRQAGDRFPKDSTHARMSQRLSDRALASALAAEREEPPATPALIQRLVAWLRIQVDKLLQRLGLVKPATRRTAPASGATEPVQPAPAQPATPGAGTPSRSVGGRQETPTVDKSPHPQAAAGHRTDAEKARRKSVSGREFAICTVPGGEERLQAEEYKIRGGSSRPLSLAERESVASTVEAWIWTEVRADVHRVIGEVCAEIGFTPPVQILWAAGQRLHRERECIPGSRPGVFVSTLETWPDGAGGVPTDEEQVLRLALDEQRRAENEKRHQKAWEKYQRHLKDWKSTGRNWLGRSNWPKPKKPTKQNPDPPSQAQVEQFRTDLTIRVVGIVRGRIEQMYDSQERIRSLRRGEGQTERPAVSVHDVPQQRQQPDRDDNKGQSR